MLHSPRMTRSQAAAAATPEADSESCRTLTAVQGAEMEAPALQAALRELQQLRAEREREREEVIRLRRSMEEQSHGGPNQRQGAGESGQYHSISKIKPDTFDGSVSLREFLLQFEIIARANGWDDNMRAVQLAAYLRGKARSVLDAWDVGMSYSELKSRLELRFGERENFLNSYTQFSNRKQKPGEDFAALGGELERLVRLAYPECSMTVRDKISCAQFIAAISDGFIKQTLQLEGVTSLKSAIERAFSIQSIQGMNFPRSGDGKKEQEEKCFGFGNKNNQGNSFQRNIFGKNFKGNNFKVPNFSRENFSGNISGFDQRKRGDSNVLERKKECWQCGVLGHFRAECPTLGKKEQLN